MVILVIAGLVMAIVAVLFAFQNAAVVTINFGTWEFEQSLAIVLICTLGLRGIKVTEYAEYLQQQVTGTPLQKADGAALPLKMDIGGVIVDPTDEVDSRSILQQAEQNLAKSLATERSDLEITEVTHKTL